MSACRHPFVFGGSTDQDLVADIFNTRRLSTVFASSTRTQDVPPVWVERAGAKVYLQENMTRQSKANLGFAVQVRPISSLKICKIFLCASRGRVRFF